MTLPVPKPTEAEVHAVRAMIAGKATGDQQRAGMRYVLEDICGIYNSPYVPDAADRETFIAVGRHQVGILITSTQTERVLREAVDAAKPTSPATRGKTK